MGVETLRAPEARGQERFTGTYDLESLRDDIEQTRVDYRWNTLETIPSHRREPLLRRYLEAIDEARREAAELAEGDGAPEHVLHRIDSVYGSELALTWHTFAPESVRKRPIDIRRKLVEWQHASHKYLLACDEQEAEKFWRTYETLSIGMKGTGEDSPESLRSGVLGPVATTLALRSRLHWEAAPPEDPEDDAFHKVDLVLRTPGRKTIVFQIDTGSPFRGVLNFDAEQVPKDDRVKTRYEKTQELRVGMREYIAKYRLDPSRVEGVYLRIPYREVNKTTGEPTGDLTGKMTNVVRTVAGP